MSENDLEKVYDPQKFEQKWYDLWMEKGFFKPSKDKNEDTYCIVIPPPNVTGSLHMGHALNNTLQDILVRYKRMKGVKTLWQCGTDHAGIATQNVVERQLATEEKTRFDLGREQFVERVWKWKEQFGGIITNQLKKLGASCDWSRERFTMDEGCSRAVRQVFVSLYKEGLIYRGNKLINWCPRCHTALSDLEAEHEDVNGHLYYVKYPSVDGKHFLTVATTRPETMPGDTAVAVNPEDDRHKEWIGKEVVLPLMGKKIPVITDEYVDLEFGTGALKITPAHDPNDFEIGQKYGLEMVKVIGDDGCMIGEIGKYKGMDRFDARKVIVEDLEKEGLLVKIEPHSHSVGHCYRCKSVVEPNLSLQWFVNVKPLAEKAMSAVNDGKTRIIPSNWSKTYFEWMNNIRDWCISRQIWWGHRIPAWYCSQCARITVEMEDPERCSYCGSMDIKQESDVLDTWFSSALWPFTTLGWPDNTEELKDFYPTSCLVTGFDILFFWVARMMMMGIKFMDDVPFKDVYIHALVRDAHGQKMSKSKGNVIDPLVIIDKFGADSFRFTLTAMAAQGRDISLSEERIEGYRNFVNKIWNASRFTLMNLEGYDPEDSVSQNYDLKDRWILSRMNTIIDKVDKTLDEYRFNETANQLYQFVWHEFCDWYVEMAKIDLYQKDDPERKALTRKLMVRILKTLLELLHPIMPFVTEEIWQKIPHSGESIVIADFPKVHSGELDTGAEKDMNLIISVVSAVRNIRSEMNILPSARPSVDLVCEDENNADILKTQTVLICSLAGLSAVSVHKEFEGSDNSATAVVNKVDIFLSLEGVIDFEEEKKRLQKELDKINKDIDFVSKKLLNQKFISRAPENIVQKEKEKLEGLQEKAGKISESISRVG